MLNSTTASIAQATTPKIARKSENFTSTTKSYNKLAMEQAQEQEKKVVVDKYLEKIHTEVKDQDSVHSSDFPSVNLTQIDDRRLDES